MKFGKPDKSIACGLPPKGGMERILSNSTKLTRRKGMLVAACNHCGLEFMRHYSLLAMYSNHYCSKSCFGLATRKRVACQCSTCGRQLEVTPYTAKHKVVCSPECMDLNRRLRRHNDKNGRYAAALSARRGGATLQLVAAACGLKTKQEASYILKRAAEHAELIGRVESLRAAAKAMPTVVRRCVA